MRRIALAMWLIFLAAMMLAQSQAPAVADYRKLATESDYVVHEFKFHDGETLAELRLHYASWGSPRRNAAGEVTNAVLLLHGTMGAGINWGGPRGEAKVHPLLGPGGALDTGEYYVIAPDTIGAGKSSKPSDGLRMKFPHYNLEDIVAAERLLVEHLGAKHLIAVLGASMGGRQVWQWGVQYPEFMDALVPMVSSPFPNTGRRGVIDFLPEAIVKLDPEWKQGNYDKNPDGARLADLMYSIFLETPTLLQEELPTRDAAEKWVREAKGDFGWPDANDFIYMMELNNGFDAWSQIGRLRCPVLMINMVGDNMVPIELEQAQAVATRVKNVTYIEVTDDAKYGHGALGRTTTIWAPKLSEWLKQVRAGK